VIWLRRVLWTAAILPMLLLSPRADKPLPKVEPISIRTRYGSVLPHEGTVTLEVMVARNKLNRGLFTAIESEEYAASTYEGLQGGDAATMRQVQFKDLPDGNYTGWAHLIREHGQTSASVTFIVGAGDEVFP
jgi:hypothetical protein